MKREILACRMGNNDTVVVCDVRKNGHMRFKINGRHWIVSTIFMKHKKI